MSLQRARGAGRVRGRPGSTKQGKLLPTHLPPVPHPPWPLEAPWQSGPDRALRACRPASSTIWGPLGGSTLLAVQG